LKSYSKRNAVAVGIQLRGHGMDGRGRERYRKTWILKNVTFTTDTESPSPAPTLPDLVISKMTEVRYEPVRAL
jgi:hypothetical protein